MVVVTGAAVVKLREMLEQEPDMGAFRLVFKGFG
jgi:hypothetical protein